MELALTHSKADADMEKAASIQQAASSVVKYFFMRHTLFSY